MIDTPITTRDELLQEHGDQKFVGEALAGMRMLNQFLNKGALCVGVTISVLAARQEIRADVAVVIGATAGLAAVGMNAVTQYRSPGLRRRHVERNRRIHEFFANIKSTCRRLRCANFHLFPTSQAKRHNV